jgi:menaquinone-dependent protoporphyrinogen oxidase
MSRILVIPFGDTYDIGPVATGLATAATAAGATARVAGSGFADRPLHGWDLVVLGAPVRHGRWHPDAHRFLRKPRDDLATVPVPVFGLATASTDDEWPRNRAALDRALERHNWLVPAAVTLFDAAPAGRSRDWRDIGEWARKLVALIELG